MLATASMRKPILAGIAISLLACSLVSLPRGVVAQDDAATGTLRERLKQRWMKARQGKPASESHLDTASRIDKPGDYIFSIVHDGLTRMYRVHVPQKYRAATPAPLVLAFHTGSR